MSELLDHDTKSKSKEEELNAPGCYNVYILNNDVTPFDVVFEALVEAANLNPGDAFARLLTAHTKGWSLLIQHLDFPRR